jgi:predicted CXXCH cytochrome family protein
VWVVIVGCVLVVHRVPKCFLLKALVVVLLVSSAITAYYFLLRDLVEPVDHHHSNLNAQFTGSESCRGCHEEQHRQWQESDHYRAMEHASDKTILGDFNNNTFTYFGRKTTFTRADGKFLVTTENQQGKLETFTVLYTLGYRPLQQYLVAFPDGSIQTLPFSWDTRSKTEGGQRWFHIYASENITPDNPLFWTRPLQNWNHMCADCHTTNFKKNFSDSENRFNSQWSELANGCESCHGPGSAHIELMKQGYLSQQLSLQIKNLHSQSEQMDQCGVCHARRDRLLENGNNENMMHTWQPELIRDVLYFHDGQIQDEVFEVGSFMQSKMFAAGVTCSNCHDPHTNKLKAEGNAVCAQCHSVENYDNKKHHFHPANSKGAQCSSCHMPERTYMVVDPRHHHGFSIPRPDLSEKLGTPNTCVSCHKDKSNAWAAQEINRHVLTTKGSHELPEHFGVALWQARHQQHNAAASLQTLINSNANNIVKATALVELSAYLNEQNLPILQTQLNDADPLIRVAAVQALANLPPQQNLPLLVNLLDDNSLAVRLALAPMMAGTDMNALTATQQQLTKKIFAEYKQWLESNSDRADALVALAGFYFAQGNVMRAQKYFDKALQRDDTSLPAYLNYADFYRSLDNDAEAEKLLRKALLIYPDSADAHYAMGLLLVRQKNHAPALKELKQAAALAPRNSHYAYVYGVGLYSNDRTAEALSWLDAAKQQFPANTPIASALQGYCAEQEGKQTFPACTP